MQRFQISLKIFQSRQTPSIVKFSVGYLFRKDAVIDNYAEQIDSLCRSLQQLIGKFTKMSRRESVSSLDSSD